MHHSTTTWLDCLWVGSDGEPTGSLLAVLDYWLSVNPLWSWPLGVLALVRVRGVGCLSSCIVDAVWH